MGIEKTLYSRETEVLTVGAVRLALKKPELSGFNLEVCRAQLEERTFGDVIVGLKETSAKICGLMHEDLDAGILARTCPIRAGNLVCGHIDDFGLGTFLRTSAWLANVLGDGEAAAIRHTLTGRFQELIALDVGVNVGYQLPMRNSGIEGRIHPRLRDLGVNLGRRDPDRPSKDTVRETAECIQREIGIVMEGIRDRLIVFFEGIMLD